MYTPVQCCLIIPIGDLNFVRAGIKTKIAKIKISDFYISFKTV